MASPKPQASDSPALCEVQVIDSSEPLVTVPATTLCSARVIDSVEPLVPTSAVRASSDDLDAGRIGLAGPSGLADQERSTSGSSSRWTSPYSDEIRSTTELDAGPSGLAGPSGMADLIMPAPEMEPATSGSSGRRINPYSDEIRSMWNWRKIFTKLGSEAQCIEFAEEQGLLPRGKQCSYHRRPMTLTAGAGQVGKFRCRKSQCRTKSESRATGTFFENVRLSLTLVFQIMYAFSEGLSYHQARRQLAQEDEPVLSASTVADWYNYCRETIVVYELEHQEAQTKIGGPNKIIQIDESKFGKRKYNRGRHIEGHWVIGMIEDGRDDLRLEVCPENDRSAESLVPLIKKHVQEGSIIHTDYWKAYLSLSDHGYVHKRVNHSDPNNKFVAPDGTHTQRIESQWRGLKKAFRQQQNKQNFTDWLIEYSWRRKINIEHKDPFHELIKAVKYVYKLRE